MHCRRVGEREHLLVLEKDEKVVANILKAAGDLGIVGGWVSGLGSVKDAELGYYDLPKRAYLKRRFEEDMELAGALGNIAMAGSERILHLHCSVSGPELISFCGHLFEAKVAVTVEFLLRDFGQRIERADDPSVGLRILQPAAPAKRPAVKGRKGGKR
jgi:predicted DNA-binding protein with PD1-like motif